jgi:hypothetical protein
MRTLLRPRTGALRDNQFSGSRNGAYGARGFCWALVILIGIVPIALRAQIAEAELAKLPPPLPRHIDFATEIQPLLAAKCLSCHSAAKQKSGFRLDSREAGIKGGDNYSPAIKPGHSAESPLIHLVAGLVPDMTMPRQGERLTAEQIGMLRAWIDQGAVWPEGSVLAADKPQIHWAFKPLTRPPEPKTHDFITPIRNPIDAFVFAKLAEQHLPPSSEADRRTLIRRLYFDLLGLPPTPEAVEAFVQDPRPNAYENLVQQLLASPRYGECWARHWLDVVRFAETHGFEMNQPRPNAWRYRDYVIRAFNDDKPYDQFVMEQLAGDVFGADEATGFIVGGAWDQVKSPDPVLTANQRADELHDMVSTTGSAFLGLTVGCARCHDHKFDPIPQRDYYSLAAVFAGVRHGERKLRSAEALAQERAAERHRRKLAEIENALTEFEPLAQTSAIDTNALRSPVNARLNLERFAPVTATRLRFTITRTTDVEPCIDELEVFSAEAVPRNVALAAAGAKATASSVFPNSDLHRLDHLNDGRYGNSRSWISNERGQGWVQLEFPGPVSISKVVWSRDREQKYADRLPLEYRIEVSQLTNEWQLVASSADRQPYVAGSQTPPVPQLTQLAPADRERAQRLTAERTEHAAQLKKLADVPMAYAGNFDAQPEPTYRLFRGDPMQKREEATPGALTALPVKFELKETCSAAEAAPGGTYSAFDSPAMGTTTGLRSLSEDQRRRLALAKWIVAPANPLTARVLVNRLWQYHFGEGLVSTPSDFGANGARPTNPELLDWLAAELVEPACAGKPSPAWSLKHIHYLMVTSSTYRQSSAPRKDCLAVDANARFLWCFPPRRLDAEAIRDSILAISGKLDLRMGGPGFSFFEPNENYVRVYEPKEEYVPEDWRRMVYGTIVRQRPDCVFGVFDCPDGGQIAPKRARTSTPLQALNLANSRFVMQQAGFFADRLKREAGTDVAAQVRRAFALTFQRQPEAEETATATAFVREQGLTLFCRALFNANEFVYQF